MTSANSAAIPTARDGEGTPLPPVAGLRWWYQYCVRQYDEPDARLFEGPLIAVRTITIGSDTVLHVGGAE